MRKRLRRNFDTLLNNVDVNIAGNNVIIWEQKTLDRNATKRRISNQSKLDLNYSVCAAIRHSPKWDLTRFVIKTLKIEI